MPLLRKKEEILRLLSEVKEHYTLTHVSGEYELGPVDALLLLYWVKNKVTEENRLRELERYSSMEAWLYQSKIQHLNEISKGLKLKERLEELKREIGTLFDPWFLLMSLIEYPPEYEVRRTGEIIGLEPQ
ncbi:MAG: hypothetical protein QW412_02175, partial [Candidatus Aenigmatarchaeota archaeon]